jgi:hypothetical protein
VRGTLGIHLVRPHRTQAAIALTRAGWLAAIAVLATAQFSAVEAVPAPGFSLLNAHDAISSVPAGGWRLTDECERLDPSAPNAAAKNCGGFALDWPSTAASASAEPETGSAIDAEVRDEKPNLALASLLTGFALAVSSVTAFANGPHEDFHFTQEHYFGPDTYAGGADKAAHFVNSSLVSRELALLYAKLGYSEVTSRWLGFGVASLGGLLIEVGDGTTHYGFSYEDLVMDVLGAGTAALISTFGADDLLGFRYGFSVPLETDTCCDVKGLGHDYSNEIYTADLKIAGVAKRLGLAAGPLKYLLVSVTYGSKGYPSGLPEQRERLVGIDVGLNLAEILNDVGIRRDTWWGYALHMVVDNVRFPYTAGGFRYDLNQGEWHGPTTR